MLTILLFIDCSKMARIRINTRNHTKEKSYLINSYFFKIVKAKKSIGWAKYVYVSEICAEGMFVTIPWWLKNVKSRSKIALFSNERHSEIWFLKRKTITFFWSKLSKLHKKDPILHVATTFSIKQGETRTSRGPIPHPLNTEWASYVSLSFVIRAQLVSFMSQKCKNLVVWTWRLSYNIISYCSPPLLYRNLRRSGQHHFFNASVGVHLNVFKTIF